MNRRDFQQLARLRLKEARALFKVGLYDGAYYLAGYTVECALKACIARRTRQHDFPPEDSRDCYQHNLVKLLGVVRLGPNLDMERNNDPIFDLYWDTVRSWRVESRYDLQKTKAQAHDLIRAVGDPKHGVLRWIKSHW